MRMRRSVHESGSRAEDGWIVISRETLAAYRPLPDWPTARLFEGAQAGDLPADDQRVDVVRPLVGVDRLQVEHVADDRVLGGDAVAAEDLPRQARAIQGDADVVALGHRDL